MGRAKTTKKVALKATPSVFQGLVITPAEQKAFLDAIDTLKGLVEQMQIGFTCSSCDSFHKDKGGHCDYWDAVVPDEQQSKGCDNWSDRIPF